MTKAHFVSWAAQDWLSSTLRGDLAMERDHVTRLVYRELLDVLYREGGWLDRRDVSGACWVQKDEAAHAVARLIQLGLINDIDGRLSSRLVLADLARQPRERAYIPRRIRRVVFQRDGRCLFCGSTERPSLDHIVRHRYGGSDEVNNLRQLCMPCNWKRR